MPDTIPDPMLAQVSAGFARCLEHVRAVRWGTAAARISVVDKDGYPLLITVTVESDGPRETSAVAVVGIEDPAPAKARWWQGWKP
jgi:hypothetical protein